MEAFEGYGRLSGRRLDEMVSGEPGTGKESPLDFALWKGRKEGEDTWWESPWGPGRPGWHIECSAMAEDALGRCFAVHGGGIDLVFPHHENEIAQSEGAHDGCMARIWMHNEMLELGDEKMSKSIGNIAPLADVLDRWPAEVVIAYFLTSHYRSRLPFSQERLEDARAVVERLANTLRSLDRAIAADREGHDPDLSRTIVNGRGEFFRALDDDFGTPEAFAALFEMVRGVNRAIASGARGRGPAARGAPRARRAARHHRPRLDRPRAARRRAPGGPRAGPPARGGPRRPRLRRRRRAARRCARWGSRSPTPPRATPGPRTRLSAAPARADGREIVYGRNPVRELLAAGAREVHRVYALPQIAGEPWLQGAPVAESTRDRLGRLAGTSDHQGVVALTDPYPYAEPADVLERPGPVVCLDGAQDPRNLGAIARVAEGAGAAGMIIPRRGSPGITPTVAKASAGAVEHLAIARVGSMVSFLHDARGAGRAAIGAHPEGGEDYPRVAVAARRAAGDGGRGGGPAAARARRVRPPRSHPDGRQRGLAQHLGRPPRSCCSRHCAPRINAICVIVTLTRLCAGDNNAQLVTSKRLSSA